jgi:hypothetical protein
MVVSNASDGSIQPIKIVQQQNQTSINQAVINTYRSSFRGPVFSVKQKFRGRERP